MEFSNIIGSGANEGVGADTSASTGTLVSSSTTANTKGSWTEITAGTARDAYGILIGINRASTAGALIDIGIGGTGSSVDATIIENILANGRAIVAGWFYAPIFLPAGTRIAARCQGTLSGTATQVNINCILLGATFQGSAPLSRATTYGADTSDSGGASLDPGATANTKGSYVQLTASTTNPIRALWVMFGTRTNFVLTDANWLVDIAIGTTIVLPDLPLGAGTTNDTISPFSGVLIPIYIPAGSQLQARAQCSITDSNDRLLDIVIIGFD